ncbi:MAG: hypothetical protein JWP10_1, partial [Nocardioidaceae bacterium]|nr:hypothetical protein [Nocardioidaceae bacterium]
MSDETPEKPDAPRGATAADSESTQVIPKIAKPTGQNGSSAKTASAVKEGRAPVVVDEPAAVEEPILVEEAPAEPEPTAIVARDFEIDEPDLDSPPKPMTAGDYVKVAEPTPIPPVAAVAPVASDTSEFDELDELDEPAGPSRREARLTMISVNPWSVTKIAFALSIAIAVVTFVAVSILWVVLGVFGVDDAINSSVGLLSDDANAFNINDYV